MHSVFFESSGYETEVVSKSCLRFGKNATNLALSQLNESGVDHIHVMYDDVIANPKQVVMDLYHQFNLDFTPEYDEKLEEYLEQNRREREELKKKQKNSQEQLHSYSAQEFGLSNNLIEEEMKDYIQEFF